MGIQMNTEASTTQVLAEKTNIQTNVDKDATAVLDAKQAVVETTTAPVTECEKENAAEPVEQVETKPVEEEVKPVETVEEVKPVEPVEEETLGKREAPEETEAPVVEEELKEE